MKKFYSVATISLLAAAGLVAQGANETTQLNLSTSEIQIPHKEDLTGKDLVQKLRKNYESGNYRSLLANLHSEHENMIAAGRQNEFEELRQSPSLTAKEEAFVTRWETLSQQLVEERNTQLKAACSNDHSLICQRVDSITTQLPSEQKEALQYLSSLRFKTPDQAMNADERKLIEIDLATEFKIIQLDEQFATKPFEDRLEKQMVLKMDMLNQMQEASKSFTDVNIKNKVALASAGLDLWQARSWDLKELKKMVQNPSTELEKKIASILSSYKTKETDLYRKEISQLQQ